MPECEIYRPSLRPKDNPSRIPTRRPDRVRDFSAMNVRATISRWCTLPSVIGVSYRCPGLRSVSIWRLRSLLAKIQWHNCVRKRFETSLWVDSCRNYWSYINCWGHSYQYVWTMMLHKQIMTGWFIRSRAISRYCSPLAWNILISVRHLNRSKEFCCLSASSDDKRAVWRRDATWGRWLCVYVTNLSCRDTQFWPEITRRVQKL